MKLSQKAKEYRCMMLRGVMPPHNWMYRVTKCEVKKIYDAYVDYYCGLVKKGLPLPSNWPARGLSKDQKEKIYAARGFGPTCEIGSIAKAKERIEKENARNEWLKSHGGQHTQDVMIEAAIARRKREEFLRAKRHEKRTRRAVCRWMEITNGCDLCQRTLLTWRDNYAYLDWCHARRDEEMRRKWIECRDSVVAKARLDSLLIFAWHRIRGRKEWIDEAVENVGLFESDNFIVTSLPEIYNSKHFSWYKDRVVGKTLADAIFIEEEFSKYESRESLSDSVKKAKSTASDNARQLRALGFVA